MAVNRGKKFEDVVRDCFEATPDVSIDRLHDQTNGYKGSSNICDFIVYREPLEYYFECKSVHGNTLSIYSITKDPKHPHDYGNITNKQWEGLLEKSQINGVIAGVICWWVDHDATAFLPIRMLQDLRDAGYKSVNIRETDGWQQHYGREWNWHWLVGKKKRVFFDYDMKQLLDDIYFYEREWL